MKIIKARGILILFIFCFMFSVSTYAEDSLEPQGILAVAKIAGACGIMDEMIDFQAKTKLEGGNEFVTRFWKAESARRGMTEQEVSDQCNQAISSYDKLWAAMEKPKQ